MIETMLPNVSVKIANVTKPSSARARNRRCQVLPFEAALTDKPGPMTMTPIVRQLTKSDASAFQTLRLEGLKNHPCEFGTAVEEEAELTLDEIERRLTEGQIYGAFLEEQLAAIAGFRRQDRVKKRHKGELFGVYVQKEARGQKLGEAVVRQVIDVAGTEVEQLLATVASLNHPAKALYAKLGFEIYGHEPRGLKVGDRYYDQEHLVLMLDQPH